MSTEAGHQGPELRGAIDWAPRLEAILEEDRRLCRELDGLSEQQAARIVDGDADALLRVLGERQAIVSRIEALNAELEPYRREWEWCMGRLSDGQRERMEGALRELVELIDRISARDEAAKGELEKRRAEVSSRISGVNRGRVAVSAYAGVRSVPGPFFQDRSC